MSARTITYHRHGGGISTLFIIIVICIMVALFTLPAMKERVHAELHAEAQSIRAAYDAGCLEVTCFIIGSGSLCEAIEYLKKKGCTQIYP